jgi:hypothetical protein
MKTAISAGFSFFLSFSALFAQSDNVLDLSNTSQDKQDYKIIASNEKFIELEYYPHFTQPLKFTYSGETFSLLSFENASDDRNEKVSPE